MESLQAQAFGGNQANYKEAVLAIPGVGAVKVYPTWNGGGTVKLVILDGTYAVPSQTLIDTVQTAIDPEVNQGVGLGLAPIGHTVTVEGATSTDINITFTLTYQTGYDWSMVEQSVQNAIDAYFLEISKTWEDNANLIVRVSQIDSRMLDLTGILDISGTTINGSTANLELTDNSIPVRGTITPN
jgi:uncharacterized phage protein gp47/JayE